MSLVLRLHTKLLAFKLVAEPAQSVMWMTLIGILQQPSEKNLLVLLDKALYRRVVLDNDHLPCLDHEHGMLKYIINMLNSDTTKLRHRKSIKFNLIYI